MTREDETDENGGGAPYVASKSARKREAASLQDLGVQLAELPDRDIAQLDLPEKLCNALRDLRRLPTHGAKFRQRQYIGKLMRSIDPEPLRAKLDERKRQHDVEIRHFQRIERWRDRLLTEAGAADQFLQEYPAADAAALKKLLSRAATERLDQRPPASARELFAFLRQLLG